MGRAPLLLLACAAAAVFGCRSNPDYCGGAPGNSCLAGSNTDAPDTIDTPGTTDGPISGSDGPPGYRPTAVVFSRSPSVYLTTGGLSGAANSPKGTYSVWIKLTGNDGGDEMVTTGAVLGIYGGLTRTSANQFRFLLLNCAAGTLLDMHTTKTYTAADGWIHVLASWDLSAGHANLYVDDALDLAAGATITNGGICYQAGSWGVGGLSGATLDADLADLYAGLGAYVDITLAANRAKFAAAGKPVDLGDACTGPTGTAPILCLHGDLASWYVNKGRGTGGGMTMPSTPLTAAATNPAD